MDVETKSSAPLDTSLLPQYQEFLADNPGLELWSYLGVVGSYELVATFSKLFWPDFVEVEGCVILAEHYYEGALKGVKLPQERESFEAFINHVHIWDLFSNGVERASISIELDEYLAKIFTVMWKHALKETFPDKEFEFYYETEPYEYGPTISFYQKDKSS